MSTPQAPEPDKWTDLLRPGYDYPEEVKDQGLNRGQRRRLKRSWRRSDKEARQTWIDGKHEEIDRERREEPASPEGRIGCVVVIASVVLILMIAGGVKSCTADDEPAPNPTSSAPVIDNKPTTSSTPSTTPTPTTSTETATSAALDSTPDGIITSWTTAWFTYTPTTGDNQSRALQRAEPWMTQELAAFLTKDDDQAARYADANGIDITVRDVQITMPAEGTTPSDHDLRLSRVATITSAYTAGESVGTTFTEVFIVVLMRSDLIDPWRVGDFTSAEH